jgi:DNA adenine methylase
MEEKQSVECRPIAPYIGGKKNLARRLIERIERTPHELYAEPFLGMGGVFLRRRLAAKREVVNDLNRDVVTLFRILQRHYVPFVEMLRWQLSTRADFQRLMATAADTLTDLERAARFLYLQRLAFGGKVAGRTFGVSIAATPARFNVTKLLPQLEEVHERLSGVLIECLGYADFIERYDRPGTLFYLDPPYWGSEDDYGRELFGRADFERLADILGSIKGRFILSLNDVAPVRKIFARFAQEKVETTYTVVGRRPTRARELIITGPGESMA